MLPPETSVKIPPALNYKANIQEGFHRNLQHVSGLFFNLFFSGF